MGDKSIKPGNGLYYFLTTKRSEMISAKEKLIMRAIAICYKPYLKPEEAMVYTNLGRTQLAKKCEEYGIYKNLNGYYSREELNLILSGRPSMIEEKVSRLRV